MPELLLATPGCVAPSSALGVLHVGVYQVYRLPGVLEHLSFLWHFSEWAASKFVLCPLASQGCLQA